MSQQKLSIWSKDDPITEKQFWLHIHGFTLEDLKEMRDLGKRAVDSMESFIACGYPWHSTKLENQMYEAEYALRGICRIVENFHEYVLSPEQEKWVAAQLRIKRSE